MRRFIMVVALGGMLGLGLGELKGIVRADGGNITRIGAFDTHTYTRYFRAGELVGVAFTGAGTTDLDLYVSCPCNNVVARDEGPTDDASVRFVAPESGYYTIRVVNKGSVANAYAIVVSD
jgi:hypothetical protein